MLDFQIEIQISVLVKTMAGQSLYFGFTTKSLTRMKKDSTNTLCMDISSSLLKTLCSLSYHKRQYSTINFLMIIIIITSSAITEIPTFIFLSNLEYKIMTKNKNLVKNPYVPWVHCSKVKVRSHGCTRLKRSYSLR